MADLKISQLTSVTPTTDDVIAVVDQADATVTKKATVGSLPISTATQSALDGKVDKVVGKGLSTEDYSSAEKSKLAGIESGAQVNVVGEAPIDGNEYARKNGAWSQITGGGGGSGNVSQSLDSGSSGRMKVSAGADKTIEDYSGGAGIVKSDADGVVSPATKGVDYGAVWTASHVTTNVNPAVPFTTYLIDASGGNITITLPNATNSTDEYRIVLEANSHRVTVTTVGGTQLIGGLATQYVSTVGGGLYIRASNDHYDIVSDTRQLGRTIQITANADLSSDGFENNALYHCVPSGGTITVTIPDVADSIDGSYCSFTIHETGTVIVKTLSGELIEGQAETTLTSGAFQLLCLGDHYAIGWDSRPKVQNSAITLYSLSEDSAISDGAGGYYKQSCTTATDARYSGTSSLLVSPTIATDTFLFGAISDAGVIDGVLPEGPVRSVLNIARNTGSASFRFYVKYFHRTSGGTETLIGTSSLSNVIDTSTIAEYVVTAHVVQTTFSTTDRLIRKVYATSGGSPTAKVSVEGTAPSFSEFSLPVTSVPHNSLAGIQAAASGVTHGHITDGTQTIAGAKTFSSTISGSVDGNSGSTNALKSATTTVNVSSASAPSAGQVLTATSSTAATWQTPSGGSGGPSQVLEYSSSGVAIAYEAKVVRLSQAVTFSKLAISLGTLPVGGNFEVNVKKNGVSILSGNLTITTSESASNSYYTVVTGDSGKATISTTTAVAEDVISLEIVAGSGNTFLGADVYVCLTGTFS